MTDGRLGTAPGAFAPVATTPQERDGAVASLAGRRVVTDGGAPVPAVAAQLEVLRRPLLTLRLEIGGRAGARQGWFAVGSGMVAGVLTLAGGRVELSLAPEVRLGAELARAVPGAAEVTGPWPADQEPGDGVPLTGQLPLALLEDRPAPGSTPEELALAQELERRTAGSLSCLVLGRAGAGLGAGQVSWLATDAGWLGLRPRPDGSARRPVDLVPVEPADLGTWVAPTVAALLEGTDEQP
nr:ESX secretion-associated protein EspG [Blastococcus saxobsidens]